MLSKYFGGVRACVRAKWAESRRAFTGPPITVIMQSSGRDKSVNGKSSSKNGNGAVERGGSCFDNYLTFWRRRRGAPFAASGGLLDLITPHNRLVSYRAVGRIKSGSLLISTGGRAPLRGPVAVIWCT